MNVENGDQWVSIWSTTATQLSKRNECNIINAVTINNLLSQLLK